MHLLIGCVIPQAEWREQWWSSLRLICQSQRCFISRSTLTAREPFSITEHWRPTDPQSRPPSILHSHSMSTHLKRLKETIKCHNVSTGCTHLIEAQLSFLSNYFLSNSESIVFYLDLHVGTSPLNSSFCAVTRASNSSSTRTFFLANVCSMLTQTHNLSIFGL